MRPVLLLVALLLLHLLLARVDVRQPLLDHPHRDLLDLLEPIRRVRDRVWHDVEAREVLDDGLLVLLLLLGGVGVVEAQQHLALVPRRVVRVEQRRLDVPDVQVARRLRREARHHLAHGGAGELHAVHGSEILLHAEELLGDGRARRRPLHKLEPPAQVRAAAALLRALLRGGVSLQAQPHGSVGQAECVAAQGGAHGEAAVERGENLAERRGVGRRREDLRRLDVLVDLRGAHRVARSAVEQRGHARCRRQAGKVAGDGEAAGELALAQRQDEHACHARRQLLRLHLLEHGLHLCELGGDDGEQRRGLFGVVQLKILVDRLGLLAGRGRDGGSRSWLGGGWLGSLRLWRRRGGGLGLRLGLLLGPRRQLCILGGLDVGRLLGVRRCNAAFGLGLLFGGLLVLVGRFRRRRQLGRQHLLGRSIGSSRNCRLESRTKLILDVKQRSDGSVNLLLVAARLERLHVLRRSVDLRLERFPSHGVAALRRGSLGTSLVL